MPCHTVTVVPPWLPAPLGFLCSPACRSPEHLVRAAAQFSVATCHRYDRDQQGRGETYCNIFLWDVTRALGCEIPHWMNAAGEPVPPGQGVELSALGVISWLGQFGRARGWAEVDIAEALKRARAGMPVVVVWENLATGPRGERLPSYVALLLPPVGDELRIAQAGNENLWDVPLARGFGSYPVKFWAHT